MGPTQVRCHLSVYPLSGWSVIGGVPLLTVHAGAENTGMQLSSVIGGELKVCPRNLIFVLLVQSLRLFTLLLKWLLLVGWEEDGWTCSGSAFPFFSCLFDLIYVCCLSY